METAIFTANNVWMMVCTALVFFMHLGFSFLEIGLTRQKNTINILFKNVFIICTGLLLYYIGGFNLMYPGDFNGYLGFAGFGIPLPENGLTPDYASGGYTYWTDFLFQGMFAATAATIVSGAVAERIKLGGFMIFTLIYVGLVYPIVGSWQWGGGFLSTIGGENGGFHDFAGSTLVHSVGGWAALIAIYLLGPRIGKFSESGKAQAIPGHNIPLAAAGVLILWLGWFGFNGGSVLSADPAGTSLVLVTTSLAAAAGGIGAFILSTILYKNYDLTMFLNGILGGLVGITAGADLMSPNESVVIGLLAGALIVLAVAFIDKIKLDDPVGAVAVHLICGIFGTLAVGVFGAKAGMDQFLYQLAGVGATATFCTISAFIILFTIKKTGGIRVSKEEELEGLDLHEHGMDAYADFRLNQH
ncbi:MAG: ammonium transporter [Flavobacteriaceae bacterium]|jgi:Amt family ammonium transporter|nr:ammonium transporter [Flavobacteriaceae bacterium]NQV63088.1 ammonium transporter [Cryomorphaceae bacterium]MCO4779382.1 ammonium transporter [Flavobacteriaceae bacterium]MCO4853945.1 ammonium transporter [Flavobacteriaceae bacterium]MDA9888182.1 ammonium transporter [Flavobacteriaceae bacterium]|tara:strand:+ start:2856 stop:4100 length:1245 start_codon:yes stop_codon:yes gene_type:complete